LQIEIRFRDRFRRTDRSITPESFFNWENL